MNDYIEYIIDHGTDEMCWMIMEFQAYIEELDPCQLMLSETLRQ